MPVNQRAIANIAARQRGQDDPDTIARHADELFGSPAEPLNDYQAPGTVRVEWIGDSSPFGIEQIRGAIRLGLLPKELIKAYEEADARMCTRIDGLTHHTMTKERDGMSQTYTWGPWNFVVEVTTADADKLLSGTFGHQFRVLDYAGTQPADYDPIDRFVKPFVSADTTDSVRAVVTDVAAPEDLSGVVPGAGMGTWTRTS